MSQPRTILVIEDDVPFAEFVCAAVESLGHRSAIVTSGADALAAFERHAPDLVFLDLLLPKRDGFAVCEDIRKHPLGAKVPIITMTGIYKKAQYERDALERAKATEYLLKPFGVREIWRILERHLGVATPGARASADATAPTGVSLKDEPLACQLRDHLQRGSDGVLFVRAPDATFVVYLRQGAPVFARSSDPNDRLDKVLRKAGKISEAQITEALQQATDSRGRVRLGATLVEKGLLTADELATAIQLQLRLILNKAFQLDAGQCLFVAGEHPTEEDVLLTASPREILLRGARQSSPAAARASLPQRDEMLERCPGWEAIVPALNLRDDEAKLLQLADGSTTVERFLASAASSGCDGARILFGLACSGLVETCGTAPNPKTTPACEEALRTGKTGPDVPPPEWVSRPVGLAIADLHRRGATGRLDVAIDDDGTKAIHWRMGRITSVASTSPSDALANMLERMKVVEGTALTAVSTELGPKAADATLARALLDRGLAGPSELYWAAVFRAHGAVHALLDVSRASMRWIPNAPEAEVVLPDVPTEELAWNGMQALDDATVRALLPADGKRLRASGDDPSMLPLTADETAFLDRLRKGCEISSLLIPDQAAARRAALAFYWMGLGVVGEASAAPPVREPAIVATTPSFDAGLRLDGPLSVPAPEPSFAPLSTKIGAATPPPQPATPLDRTDPRELKAASPAPPPALRPAEPVLDPAPRGCDFLDMLHADALRGDGGMTGLDEAEDSFSELRKEVESALDWQRAGRSTQATIRDLAQRLKDLRPVVRTLRGGLDGDDRRVLVDRARMAELFDGLLAAMALLPPSKSSSFTKSKTARSRRRPTERGAR